jgi:hypothetical protein
VNPPKCTTPGLGSINRGGPSFLASPNVSTKLCECVPSVRVGEERVGSCVVCVCKRELRCARSNEQVSGYGVSSDLSFCVFAVTPASANGAVERVERCFPPIENIREGETQDPTAIGCSHHRRQSTNPSTANEAMQAHEFLRDSRSRLRPAEVPSRAAAALMGPSAAITHPTSVGCQEKRFYFQNV